MSIPLGTAPAGLETPTASLIGPLHVIALPPSAVRATPASNGADNVRPTAQPVLSLGTGGLGGLVRSLGANGTGIAALLSLFLFALALTRVSGLPVVPAGFARHAFHSPLERPG
ncbi:MAG TPA: hypothetical protein VGG41_18770 [Solirubrobacteraceae bacterium]